MYTDMLLLGGALLVAGMLSTPSCPSISTIGNAIQPLGVATSPHYDTNASFSLAAAVRSVFRATLSRLLLKPSASDLEARNRSIYQSVQVAAARVRCENPLQALGLSRSR